MRRVKVAVHGASGRMGQTVVDALCREPDMQIVGAVDIKAAEDNLPLPDGSGKVPFSKNLARAKIHLNAAAWMALDETL